MSRAGASGGLPARRAVVRWAGRLLRRDWRQHLLIVSLLTVAVAAAIGLTCAAFNIAPGPGRAEFGDGDHFFRFEHPDAASLTTKLDAAKEWFGTIDAIGHRSVLVPGSVDEVDYRSQDPSGPYGHPLLALRAGRYPATDGEVAVSDWVASTFGANIGSTIDLDGVARTVVGKVENPSDLGDKFVLLPPSALAQSDDVKMIVKASESRVESFRPPGDTGRIVGSRGDVSESLVASVITLVVSTVVMFLIALIAAASFAVIAQRRLPQLGMMAAVGATEKHLRLTMVATGALTGLVAGILGGLIGLGGWVALAPRLEQPLGFRIDALSAPWWLIAVGMLLAVVTATAAAWWPGRTLSRIPPVVALSGRPPRPAALDRSVALASAFVAGGAVCLAVGSKASGHATTVQLVLIAAGTLGLIAGVLMFSPLALRAVAHGAARAPVAARLALRDLGRYQARSGAALAAIALALGIPVAIFASAAAAQNDQGPGNLPATDLLIRTASLDGPFVPEPSAIANLQTGVDELAAALDHPTVLRLDAAVAPGATTAPEINGIPAVSIVRVVDNGFADLGMVYVASPGLLAEYGSGGHQLAPDTDVVTSRTGPVRVFSEVAPSGGKRRPVTPLLTVPGRLPATYTSLPVALISPERLAARGWQAAPSGRWLIQRPDPITPAELSQGRLIAARYGLTIEHRTTPRTLANLRIGAVAVGMLLALGILAMTVGLIRAESAGELRTLTATGATSSTRRAITATTAGGLAALGALLGIAGAYLALAAGRLANLTPLPLVDLALIAIGTPLVAAAAGWLVAGREPAVLARRPIE
jgi:putative ABC transport system permease protein